MSELALKLIAENKKTKATFLDLGNCGLTELPDELFELTWLEGLSLGIYFDEKSLTKVVNSVKLLQNQNQIDSLDGIGNLINLNWLAANFNNLSDLSNLVSLNKLTRLDLFSNKITDITDLSEINGLTNLSLSANQISDYSYLSEIKSLTSLNLSKNQISDISILSELKSLTSLNLSRNQINDISILSDLKSLTSLSLSFNQISDYSYLSALKSLTSLDLSSNKISDISILSELKSLTSLGLSDNQISDISILSALKSLTSLDLRDNQINDISILSVLKSLTSLDLGYNRISDISILSELKSLTSLSLSSNRISDISILSALKSLTSLDLRDNQIRDISTLSQLKSLTSLDLRDNQIRDISILSDLKSLTSLNLSSNQISDISTLSALKSLTRLDLRDNQIKDLKPLLHLVINGQRVSFESYGGDIILDNNPIEFPPLEIVKQGDEAIIRYFEQLDKHGVDHLYEAKMLIVGEGGMGKTTLIKKLLDRNADMPKEEDTTKGIDIYSLHNTLEEKDFKINAWDFGGQEIYHATHQFFLTKRSLYILVDDTRKDGKSSQDAAFKYWLQTVELFGDNSPMLIVQNERKDRSKDLDFKAIRGKYEFVKEKFATNLLDCRGLDAVEKEIWHQVLKLPHVGQALPKPWIPIREELIALSKEKPYISDEEYIAVCRKHDLKEEKEAYELSHYLHDLGTFLHFQDDELLQRIIILQNEWATEAVYRLLDDEEIKGNFGRFNQTKAKKTWHEAHYKRKIPELLNLMMKFELCYPLPDKKNHFLIPQLLPNSKPDHLHSPGVNSLQLRYRYDFLPKGLISRFIVRTHQYIQNQKNGWKSGVELKWNNSIAFVEESYNQNLISIWITRENQKEFMTIVSEEMDKLNKTYQGIKVEKLVPCNCASCKNRSEPHFYEYQNLFNRIRKGKKTIECQKEPYHDVDVIGLVDDLYQQDYLRKVLIEDIDKTDGTMSAPLARFVSDMHSVKDGIVKTREEIRYQTKAIEDKIDTSNELLADKIIKKLSKESADLLDQINTYIEQSSGDTEKVIGDLVFETLDKIEKSNQDIKWDLDELKSKTHSIKAKMQMGLPYLLSIEAEKDVTEEMTSFKKSFSERFPKAAKVIQWLNEPPKN